MQCPICGNPLSLSVLYCGNCGVKVVTSNNDTTLFDKEIAISTVQSVKAPSSSTLYMAATTVADTAPDNSEPWIRPVLKKFLLRASQILISLVGLAICIGLLVWSFSLGFGRGNVLTDLLVAGLLLASFGVVGLIYVVCGMIQDNIDFL